MDRLIAAKKKAKCVFCKSHERDKTKYGPIFRLDDTVVHYYCVLLSSKMKQNGNDDEGMFGFLLKDIKAEYNASVKFKCCYCERGHATLKCSGRNCAKKFHYTCGVKNQCLSQFFGEFKTYCNRHRQKQKIPPRFAITNQRVIICAICLEEIQEKTLTEILWAPCCKTAWYHRKCLQKLANSAGYFFRCAMCNNKEEFNNEMMQQGIFIQNRDASWELVPNAFAELLFRHSTCNAKQCKCRAGRHKNLENTKWEIILCKCCGSQGIHVECGQQLRELRKGGKSWQCYSCIEILRKHPGNVAKEITGILMNDRGEELPIPGSSNTTSDCKQSPSKEEYIRKRQRLPTDSENLVLDKRKCNASPCEEIIDVENIDTEMLSKELLLMKEKAKSTSDYDSRLMDKYDIHEFYGEKNEYKNKHQIDRNEIVILSSDSEYDVIHSCDSESQSDEEDDEIQVIDIINKNKNSSSIEINNISSRQLKRHVKKFPAVNSTNGTSFTSEKVISGQDTMISTVKQWSCTQL